MIDIIDAIVAEIDDEPNSPEYDAARHYHATGFNVIPLLHQTKKPAVKYADLHHRRQGRAEVAMMKPLFDGGVAVITGTISNIVVIDTDGPEGEAVLCNWEAAHVPLPVTLTIRSGGGRGVHRYFQHPGSKVTTKTNSGIKLDIKGDGGIAVLPPTLHKSGARYTVEIDAPIAALPDGLLGFIEAEAAKAKGVALPKTNLASNKRSGFGNINKKPSPVNLTNVAIVRSMLKKLPDEYANDYDLWIRVGFALRYFDDGEVGLALWKRFSDRCPHKAGRTDFAARWASFNRKYSKRKITLGWLWEKARAHGWLAPCRWDRSTRDKFEG